MILNSSKNSSIARNHRVADTFISRMVGLLNKKVLTEGEALIITRCKSIHMLFMRFAIDVIFVDKSDCVVGLCEHIKPFQLSPLFPRSSYAIEIAAGTISRTNTAVGDKVEIKD